MCGACVPRLRTTQKMASKYGEYTAEEFKPKSGFMSKVFGK